WSPLRRTPSRRCSVPTISEPIARASWRPRRTAMRAGAVTSTVSTSAGAGAAAASRAAAFVPRWRFWAAWRVMLSPLAIVLQDAPATRAQATASRSSRSSSPRRTVIARSASSGSSVLTARLRRSPRWRSPEPTIGCVPGSTRGNSGCLDRGGLRQAEAADLDRRAAVHDDLEAGGTGALRGGLVDHAELHPDRAGADGDGLVHVRPGRIGAAEDVDDV